jgi:hypothetical protein
MSKAEKENRINSLALTFLERQQIVPNLYADQIIRGYKAGYHQAEKDLELTWKDIECIIKHYQDIMSEKSRVFVRVEDYQELLKRFKNLKK